MTIVWGLFEYWIVIFLMMTGFYLVIATSQPGEESHWSEHFSNLRLSALSDDGQGSRWHGADLG